MQLDNFEGSFRLYRTYLAIKQHFDSGSYYDYEKYKGQVNVKLATFQKRRDLGIFRRLSGILENESDNFESFFVAQTLKTKELSYPAAYLNKDAKEQWKLFQSFQRGLAYSFDIFLNDLSEGSRETLKDKIKSEYVLGDIVQNQDWKNLIHYSILDNITGFSDYYDKASNNILWTEFSYYIKRLDCLLVYNRSSIQDTYNKI